MDKTANKEEKCDKDGIRDFILLKCNQSEGQKGSKRGSNKGGRR